MPVVIMTFNALTEGFRTRLETMVGSDARYYNAADLRRLSFAEGVKDLRRIEADRIVVAIENEAGRALIGPLSLAAACTRARRIEVVWPDFRSQAMGRVTAAGNIFRLARDTLHARRALVRGKAGIAELTRASMPRAVPPASGTRVLYIDANISLGSPVGGYVGHTAGVVEALLDREFSVDYASLKRLPVARSDAAWLKLEPGTLLAVPAELNYYPYAELIEKTLAQAHRRQPWSFIYQRFSLHNFSGPALGRRLNVPCVLEFNGSEVWAAEHWGSRLTLHDEALAAEQAALTAADLIVTVSDPLAEELQRKGVPEQRILVHPNCVDTQIFDPARFAPAALQALRAQYAIAHDAFVVMFIGTFGHWHGVDFLAECIRALVHEDPDWIAHHKLHFLLVGDGLKMPMVRETLGDERTRRHVTLTGLVPQLEAPRYLACADLLLSPHVPNPDGSEFFGSPTKLFEYMAMRRPILAAALGQIEDVVAGRGATRRGRLPAGAGVPCGMLFEPGDPEAFKRQLRALVNDPGLAASLARAARAEVLARYTWGGHVDAILERMSELNLLDRRGRDHA